MADLDVKASWKDVVLRNKLTEPCRKPCTCQEGARGCGRLPKAAVPRHLDTCATAAEAQLMASLRPELSCRRRLDDRFQLSMPDTGAGTGASSMACASDAQALSASLFRCERCGRPCLARTSAARKCDDSVGGPWRRGGGKIALGGLAPSAAMLLAPAVSARAPSCNVFGWLRPGLRRTATEGVTSAWFKVGI